MASLVNCYVTFAIPAWSSSEWQGSDILFGGVTIFLGNGVSYYDVGEHRNSGVGPNNAVYLNVPFNNVKDKIDSNNIGDIHLVLTGRHGLHKLKKSKEFVDLDTNSDTEEKVINWVQFRTEVVLVFPDKKYLATGYTDVEVIGTRASRYFTFPRDKFHPEATLKYPFG